MAVQDKFGELLAINPMESVNHSQTTQHPPAIAHVLELLRSAVQAAVGEVALAQPGTQAVSVN